MFYWLIGFASFARIMANFPRVRAMVCGKFTFRLTDYSTDEIGVFLIDRGPASPPGSERGVMGTKRAVPSPYAHRGDLYTLLNNAPLLPFVLDCRKRFI